jgi:hypothetical protein
VSLRASRLIPTGPEINRLGNSPVAINISNHMAQTWDHMGNEPLNFKFLTTDHLLYD